MMVDAVATVRSARVAETAIVVKMHTLKNILRPPMMSHVDPVPLDWEKISYSTVNLSREKQ
jgi:hypothetical protein